MGLASSEEQYENVNFWDLSTGNLIRTLDFRHDHLAVGCYERWLLGIVYNANVIIALNLETEESILVLDAAPHCLPPGKGNITPLAISPFEPIIVCGGDILYREPQTGQIKAYNLFSESIDRESSGLAECLAVNHIGQLLACGLREEHIQVWDLYTDKVICFVDGHLPISMTMDGRFLAYCRNSVEIIIWDIQNNRDIGTLDKSSAMIELITLSPNGKWIASYNQDRKIEVWSIFE